MTTLTDAQRERIATLIAALRSGDYAQTRGTLRRADTYCCLGVACDLSGQGEWVHPPAYNHEDGPNPFFAFQSSDATAPNAVGVMPAVVIDYYGTDLTVETGAGCSLYATHLNDDEHWKFDQIANLWEEALLEIADVSFHVAEDPNE